MINQTMQIAFSSPNREIVSKQRSMCLHRPKLVGVINVTPDSFSDGGRFQNQEDAIVSALRMEEQGADWIDIGGESSGPGTADVSLEEELDRVIPIIAGIRKRSEVWISVDTWKSEVAKQSILAGADVINDVTALRKDPALAQVIAEEKVPLVLMYSKDSKTRTTVKETSYTDVMISIKEFFKERILWSQLQGIASKQLILDPGMGFFVSGNPRYSFQILRRLQELQEWGYPLFVGTSRKSFLAQVSKNQFLEVHQRELPSMITSSIAVWEGASFVRVHDVAQGKQMMDTMWKLISS